MHRHGGLAHARRHLGADWNDPSRAARCGDLMRPLGLGIVIGLALGLLLRRELPRNEAPAGPREQAESDEIRTLRGALEIERELRRQLVEEIEAHETQAAPEVAGERGEASARAATEPAPPTGPVSGSADRAAAPAGQPWFGREALISLGMHPSEVERIHERWEQYVLDKLHVDDEHMRSGEGGQERFFKLLAIERDVREDLGDEDYDAMLFASGANNRVIIQDVLESSPGGEAGLQAGDRVIRYDDRRIFDPLGLRHATAQGTPGETVWMEVLRDGRLVTVRVPRGPLGVRIGSASETPLPR